MSQYLDKDGTSRIAENFLSKQAEQDAILANLQFDLKEAEHALVKTIQGPAPLNIRALTRPLDDYLISGNTTQNGTPSPDVPVDVVGVGVKTGNLFDLTDYTSGYNISLNGEIVANPNYLLSGYIFCTAGTYTLSGKNTYNTTANIANRAILYDENKENPVLVLDVTGSKPVDFEYTFQILESGFLVFSFRVTDINIMLNTGSTSKPYEPYGYKLPLTVNGTEYPIYLGQVPTTRRVKKLVLTGNENWTVDTSANHAILRLPDIAGSRTAFSTHYKGSVQAVTGNVWINTALDRLFIMDTAHATDATSFKQWLAAQYAAGTPVTVWYVLATPTTGIVNEPLHKIEDYADTISYAQSGVEISTTKGFNTITTDTTVLPSNIEVKGVINNA